MSYRDPVAPETLAVDIKDDAITVEYLDGRAVTYDEHPTPTTPPVRAQQRRFIQVLVADAETNEGILIYVNDLDTEAEILEDTGVGRAIVRSGETTELFPGVTATVDGQTIRIDVDPDSIDERVFVFEESALTQRAYELTTAPGGG